MVVFLFRQDSRVFEFCPKTFLRCYTAHKPSRRVVEQRGALI
jgi:hypothetical protein